MARMIMGVIPDRDMAEHAVEELQEYGFNLGDISIVMRDQDQAREVSHNTGAYALEGAMTGVTVGGILGGLAGLLVGIGAIVLPGVGAVLIGGPLVAALGLSGAVTGAVAGGLVGALVGTSVPEEDARYYEEQVRGGGVLVAVPVDYGDEIEAKAILEDHNATGVKSFGEEEPLRRRRPEDIKGFRDDYKSRDEYRYAGTKGGEVSDVSDFTKEEE